MGKYASKIPRNVLPQEVQKCVLLVTIHILKFIDQVNHDIVMIATRLIVLSSGDGLSLISE